MQFDVLKMARESGMTIVLDGRIGQEAYMSVSGSTDALQKFACDVRASLLKRPRRKARAACSASGNPLVMARMRARLTPYLYRGGGALHTGRLTRHARVSPRTRCLPE
ncbi:hypothetical protein QCE63_17560 [Caballeronia sp. LZ065]|uniref:hypothetical protein n=1 Tax=Caballeronia sp. LZ065 TaxID=3038571 RepID=UPI002859DF09|nr:hypothetical protein [Caballeronia sp. LZ065]MDR5781215.1 hypothetical protein [Caballeronia sp. LZ065]